MTTQTQQRPLLTLSDVVTRVNLSERTVRRHIARGEVPAIRLGTRIRVDQEELERWIAGQRGHYERSDVSTKADGIVARVEEAADIALGSAQIARKAAEKVVDAIPTPDPREDVNYQRLAGLEQSMLARISPRHKNRWPGLRAIDERIEALDLQQEELRLKLGERHERRQRADADYAAAFAEWMAAGQQEPKPVSEATALDQAIVEGQAELAAFDLRRDQILEERIAFVKKHRKRLVRDAEASAGPSLEDRLTSRLVARRAAMPI